MIAAKNINFNLVKLATILSGLLVINYFLWLVNMQGIMTNAVMFLYLIIVACFIIYKPFSNLPLKILIIFSAVMSLGSSFGSFDTPFIWLLHSKRIFFGDNIFAQLDNYPELFIPSDNSKPDVGVASLGYNGTHNDYPVFVAVISATIVKIIGHWNNIFPKISNIISIIPALMFLTSMLKSRRQELLLCTLLFLLLNSLLYDGRMDGILAIYFTAASLVSYILVKPDETEPLSDNQKLWLYFLAAELFISLTLIKNEGLVLFLILISACFFMKIISKKIIVPFKLSVIFFLSLIPIIIWKYNCHKNGVFNDLSQGEPVSRFLLRIRFLDYYTEIFSGYVNNLYIPLVIFVIAVSKKLVGKLDIIFIGYITLSYLAVLFFVYMSTPYSLEWHLENSMDRVVFPLGLMLIYYPLLILQQNLCRRQENRLEGWREGNLLHFKI